MIICIHSSILLTGEYILPNYMHTYLPTPTDRTLQLSLIIKWPLLYPLSLLWRIHDRIIPGNYRDMINPASIPPENQIPRLPRPQRYAGTSPIIILRLRRSWHHFSHALINRILRKSRTVKTPVCRTILVAPTPHVRLSNLASRRGHNSACATTTPTTIARGAAFNPIGGRGAGILTIYFRQRSTRTFATRFTNARVTRARFFLFVPWLPNICKFA